MDPPPPPAASHSSSSSTSFPILIISIVGILTTAILLLSYYIFVIKCCLNWRGPSLIFRTLSTGTPRRRPYRTVTPIIQSSPTELRGLDPSAIRALPIIRFSGSGAASRKSSSHECAVCLNEFREEESVRLLPGCFHAFHIDCIDVWLQSNANCPICRSEITTTISFPFPMHEEHSESAGASGHMVIDVRDEAPSGGRPSPSPRKAESSSKKKKRMHHVFSMGDECIDGRVKDERFVVQPMRRSFSMDSCNDRQLYVAVQEILRQKPEMLGVVRGREEGGRAAAAAGGRVRRSFFSFGHGRSWRKAVLPVQIEL